MTKKRVWIILGVILIVGAAAVFYAINRPQPKQRYISFSEARAVHTTTLLQSQPHAFIPLPVISHKELQYTTYSGELGDMHAIASKRYTDGVKRPAVVWVTGGFGGIFQDFDKYGDPRFDQGIASFLDKDIVNFLPTLRGEHGNPGVFECFYGEVDDIVSALKHVAARSDVDPLQIYLMGHSSGGTNVLLAALNTDIPRHVYTFSAAPDMHNVIANGGYGVEPYDTTDFGEVRRRSAINFTRDIKVPTTLIETDLYGIPHNTDSMWGLAQDYGVPLDAIVLSGATHTSYLRPLKDYLAEQIAAQADPPSPIDLYCAYQAYLGRDCP